MNCLLSLSILLALLSLTDAIGFPMQQQCCCPQQQSCCGGGGGGGGGGCCGGGGGGCGGGGGGGPIIVNCGSGGGGGGGCGCGGGGGGCCGRKKREAAALEAVQPHFKSDETPCPQTEWRQVIDESIRVDDAIGSVGAIQTALYRRYANQKFLVTCSAADEAKNGTNKVHFSSSGDGYCNLVKEQIWCQAVALSA
ncbi:hypothetical protein niasHT_031693 [Heterodera trifolii]|uniref:Ground-like domain-containing protein n=1 Tax=Heterodera trifolii TaxID=157864 RepID=A0ABD2IYP1_9BILA